MGAREFGFWDYSAPRVVASARGRNDLAERRLEEYLALVRAADYPSPVKEPPPWGATCSDPRARDDEDRDTHLGNGVHAFERTPDGVRLALPFQNVFAGALAVNAWLEGSGYTDVEVSVEAILTPLDAQAGTQAPVTGLFGDVRSLEERLVGAEPEKVIDWLFRAGKLSDHFTDVLAHIPPARVAEMGLAQARTYWARRLDVTPLCVQVIEHVAPSSARAAWARALWDQLNVENSTRRGRAVAALAAALPHDEAYARAQEWCDAATTPEERAGRLMSTWVLHDSRVLDLIEQWWRDRAQPPPVTESWSTLVAETGLPWARLRRWLESGRPLSLLAVDVLRTYVKKGPPQNFGAPTMSELRRVLEEHAARDPVPRVRQAIDHVLQYPAPVASDAEGI
jgi:hypothetical protein